MKLGVCISTPDVNLPLPVALLTGALPDKLAKAQAMGFDGVELLVMEPAQVDAAQVRAMVAARGLDIAAIGTGAVSFGARLNLLHQDAGVREQAVQRLHEIIEFAARAGAPLVTIGSLRGWRRSVPGDGMAVLVDVLRTAAIRAGEQGIRLAIEPLNRYEADCVNTVQDALDLISGVGSSQLGLLLDTFHANIEEAVPERSLETALRSGRLWHIHLGDSNRLPTGQGHFDFGGLVRILRQAKYAGYLCAELLGKPDPDTAARLTANYMLPLIRDERMVRDER